MSLPSSSVLVAADSMMNSASRPSCSTRCFMTNSAIGERQIFPLQTKRIRFILINLLVIYIEYIIITFFCRLYYAIIYVYSKGTYNCLTYCVLHTIVQLYCVTYSIYYIHLQTGESHG